MNQLATFLLGALLVGTLAGCGPEYDRTEISAVKGDFGGAINMQRLTVAEGMILKAHIAVWNDDDEQMSLSIRSADTDTIEVAGVVSPNDFVFIGKKQGLTQVHVVADDEVVLTINAEVTAQPAPP